MKNPVLIFSLSLLLFSCTDLKPKVPQFIISGRIENLDVNTIVLEQGKEKFTFTLDVNGEFSDTISDFENGYFKLTAGKEYTKLYLKDGYDVYVYIDAAHFDESIKYEGIGASENNFIAKQMLYSETVNFWDFCTFQEDTFLFKIDSFIDSKNQLLNEYASLISEFDKDLVNLEKANNAYQAAYVKEEYKATHEYFNKVENLVLSPAFYDYRKNVVLEDKKALKLEYYPSYVESYIANQIVETDTSEVAFDLLRKIDSEIKDNELKKEFIYRSAKENITSVKQIEEYWALVSFMVTDKSEYSELKKLYRKVKKIEIGNSSPQANFKDVAGKEFSLEDFKGKYVYIDCWAQWCAPCIKETPFLNALEEKFAKKDIVFVKLSLDSDANAWSNYITENNITKHSYLLEKNFDSDFAKAYLINSIPRFILLDKDLKILNSNAPRPSNPALEELFNTIL